MSERWKPVRGETYYFMDSVGIVNGYEWREDSTDSLYYKNGNCFKKKAEAEAAAEKVKALLLRLHEPTKDFNQLPKLTAKVFDRPDCPEWAKWAAVDRDGVACYFADKPTVAHGELWWLRTQKSEPVSLWYKFDASDWQNSLIERPAVLPEWCKVCGYGYDLDTGYFKIVEIIDCGRNLKVEWVEEGVQGTVFGCNLKYRNQARLRPYNAEEMRGLVGILIRKGPSLHIVTGYENVIDGECMVHVNGCLYSANDLLRQFAIDNEPCGVLEHLNEKGEWVE